MQTNKGAARKAGEEVALLFVHGSRKNRLLLLLLSKQIGETTRSQGQLGLRHVLRSFRSTSLLPCLAISRSSFVGGGRLLHSPTEVNASQAKNMIEMVSMRRTEYIPHLIHNE